MKENLNKGDEEAEDEVEINHLNVGCGGETVGKLRYVVLWEGSSITGCPKKNETGFLLNISATKYRIFK